MSNESQSETTGRPLAPAPPLILLPVSLGAIGLTVLVALRIHHDWLAVFAFLAVMFVASVVLNIAGRVEAQRHPNALYTKSRLPREKSKLRAFFVGLTFLIALMTIIASAQPGRHASPLPYFLAVLFLYLVLPQLLAHRIVRRQNVRQ